MSKQYKVEQVEVMKQEGGRFFYGGHEYKRISEEDCHLEKSGELLFMQLAVGDHFMWGGEEHIKIQDLTTGCSHMGCCEGIVNNVSYKGQVSGMGSEVRVKPVRKHDCLTATQRKYFEDTMANIKQLQDDDYRAGQRLSSMRATVYTLYAQFTGEPGY